MRNRILLLAGLVIFNSLLSSAAWAKNETSFGFGNSFYTGDLRTSLAPRFAPHFQFESASLESRAFNFAHRTQVEIIAGGTNLAGAGATYNGLAVSYELGFRLNLGQKSVIPYLEIAPALNFFGLLSSAATANSSTNQAALKFGYTVNAGFDKYSGDGGRGSGGWGIAASYFYYSKSPSAFEFDAGHATAKGVRIDFRFHFGAN